MKNFTLSNGITIPAVGYGSYLSTAKSGKDVIKDALDAGYRYIDTARMYKNEAEIGVSNFLPHHLRPMLEEVKVKPMVDQLELHAGYMQEYTLAYLAKEGILPQAWSPLGRARLIADQRVQALADKYGKSAAQVLLKFLVQRDIPVIPKASSIERMKENLDIFDFDLTEDEISFLSCIPEAGWSGEHPDLGVE